MSSTTTNEAFVTLATSDNQAIGALTLAQSLRKTNTTRQLCILITNEIDRSLKNVLDKVFDRVEVIQDEFLQVRAEHVNTFRKLYCWRLATYYTKCVFVNADCLVLKNVDDLFDRDEWAAASDVGWPDCFNTGVFVFRPSLDTYSALQQLATSSTSVDASSDYSLLNAYFNTWNVSDASKRLPFIYNMTTNASYSYAPAFKEFNDLVRIVHFYGSQKPWYFSFNTSTGRVIGNICQYERVYVEKWWSHFSESVYALLDSVLKDRLQTQYIQPDSKGVGSEHQEPHVQSSEISFSQFSDIHSNQSQVVIGSGEHQSLWEQGQIDYTGRDSFANIQAHLDSKLNK
jgi:glycogenin glucosyltransferase